MNTTEAKRQVEAVKLLAENFGEGNGARGFAALLAIMGRTPAGVDRLAELARRCLRDHGATDPGA